MKHCLENLSATFCAAPWVHFVTYTDGFVYPCCGAREFIRKEDGAGYNIRRDKPDDIWNSVGFKQIRQSLLNGDKIPHCAPCYEQEKKSIYSSRWQFNRDYGQKYLDRLIDQSNPLEVKKPIYVDMRLGNICNLRCRTCTPGFSSEIEKDKIACAWIGCGDKPVGKNLSDWPEAVDLMADLKDFCGEATKVVWVGGEPTVNRSQTELIQHFVDQGAASGIDILMVSNLMNSRDRVYALANSFKTARIHMSIEGIGQVNEYIRFPSKWQVISENVKNIRQKYKKIVLAVTPTYQAYNILYVCDMFDWCLENNIPFTVGNILGTPPFLSVNVLPLAVRIIAAERLEQWVEARSALYTGNCFYDNVKSGILNIALLLRDPKQQASEIQIDNFVRFTNDLDFSRKQDIRESLPELYELWTKHYPWDHQAFRHRENFDLGSHPNASINAAATAV